MTTDRIYSFFNNEMTVEQEREFLISVASSDSLRREVKSHVKIERYLNNELNNTIVPEHIRQNIFDNLPNSYSTPVTKKSLVNRWLSGLVVASTFALGFAIGNQAGNIRLNSVSENKLVGTTPSNINNFQNDTHQALPKEDSRNNTTVAVSSEPLPPTTNKAYNQTDVINEKLPNRYKKNIHKSTEVSSENNSTNTVSEHRVYSDPLNPKKTLSGIRTSPLDPTGLAKPTANYNKEYETSNPLNPKSLKKQVSGTPLDPVNKGSQISVPASIDAGSENK